MSHLGAAAHLEGKRTEGVILDTSAPVHLGIEAGGSLVTVCVYVCMFQIVLACLHEVSTTNKTKFLLFKKEAIRKPCFSKYVPQNMCYKQKCF